jgi:hypothetical protein
MSEETLTALMSVFFSPLPPIAMSRRSMKITTITVTLPVVDSKKDCIKNPP